MTKTKTKTKSKPKSKTRKKRSSHLPFVKRYSSKPNAFIQWVEQNFNFLGSGCTSKVYSKDGLDFVIKISRCGGITEPRGVTKKIQKYFLYPLFISNDGKIAIQHKAEIPSYSKRETIANKIERLTKHQYDIHPANVGIFNRRHVAFDY